MFCSVGMVFLSCIKKYLQKNFPESVLTYMKFKYILPAFERLQKSQMCHLFWPSLHFCNFLNIQALQAVSIAWQMGVSHYVYNNFLDTHHIYNNFSNHTKCITITLITGRESYTVYWPVVLTT